MKDNLIKRKRSSSFTL